MAEGIWFFSYQNPFLTTRYTRYSLPIIHYHCNFCFSSFLRKKGLRIFKYVNLCTVCKVKPKGKEKVTDIHRDRIRFLKRQKYIKVKGGKGHFIKILNLQRWLYNVWHYKLFLVNRDRELPNDESFCDVLSITRHNFKTVMSKLSLSGRVCR